jgi:hypothetical protein
MRAADNREYEPLLSGSASLRAGLVAADTRSASYLLPLKADARRGEGIAAGDRVTVSRELRA